MEDIGLSPREMLGEIFRQWRQIIIVMLISALVLGAFRLFQDSGIVVSEEEYAAHQIALNAYPLRKSLLENTVHGNSMRLEAHSGNMARIDSDISELDTYIKNSVLMKINAMQKPTARTKLAIHGEGISGEALQQLWNGYAAIAWARASTEKLNELVSVRKGDEAIYGSVSKKLTSEKAAVLDESLGYGVLVLECVHTQPDKALGFIRDVEAELRLHTDRLGRSIFPHTLEVLQEAQVFSQVDIDLREYQKNISNERAALADRRDIQLAVATGAITNKSQAENDLAGLIEPVLPSIDRQRSNVASAVRYGILGFVAGAFLAVAFCLLRALICGRIRNEWKFAQNYNIPVLGTLSAKEGKRKDIFQRLADRIETVPPTPSTREDAVRMILASIENCEEQRVIACVGENMDTLLASIAEKLNDNGNLYILAGDVLRDAQAVQSVRKSTDVILFGYRHRETYGNMDMQISRLRALGVNIMGIVGVV